MEYTKPPLTFDEQAYLLISRRLVADRQALIQRLQSVNYYRLSGYLYPFRSEDDTYQSGTTLDQVWHIYVFDRQMRVVVMDAIERVEVAVRTQLAYYFARQHGPFGYILPQCLAGIKPQEYEKWLRELRGEVERSSEIFIRHFQEKYGDVHTDLPIWMLTEVMSFGKTLTFYRGVSHDIQQSVALRYGIPHNLLESCLQSLNAIRNICAHHGRLWNRALGYRPKLPSERKHPEWYDPFPIPQEKLFSVLTILRFLLKYDAPTSKWKQRLLDHLGKNPGISLRPYGFSDKWAEHTLWK